MLLGCRDGDGDFTESDGQEGVALGWLTMIYMSDTSISERRWRVCRSYFDERKVRTARLRRAGYFLNLIHAMSGSARECGLGQAGGSCLLLLKSFRCTSQEVGILDLSACLPVPSERGDGRHLSLQPTRRHQALHPRRSQPCSLPPSPPYKRRRSPLITDSLRVQMGLSRTVCLSIQRKRPHHWWPPRQQDRLALCYILEHASQKPSHEWITRPSPATFHMPRGELALLSSSTMPYDHTLFQPASGTDHQP